MMKEVIDDADNLIDFNDGDKINTSEEESFEESISQEEDDGEDDDADDGDESEIDDNIESFEYIDPKDQYQLIVRALCRRDTKELKKLALCNEGFINDELRKLVWPRIVNVHIVETSPRPDKSTIESHPFYNQVLLDVNRSLKRFPPSVQEQQRLAMQDQLIRLIMRVLIKNPALYYYQGYHDICVTFLLVLGEEMAFYLVNKISKTHLSVFMEKTMDGTSDLLSIVPGMISLESPPLGQHLEQSSVGTIFSLSWIITWFSHVLKKYDHVGRLFDLFLSTHPWMPVYMTVAIVIYKQDELLSLPCDMPTLHQFLTDIPESCDLPFELLISKSLKLFTKYPPDDIKVFKQQAALSRQKLANRSKHGFVRTIFRFTGLFYSKKFMSFTVFVVFCATLFQYFFNSS